MPDGQIAQKEPYMVDVKAGRTYWWCACGLSNSQPFCDGSHKQARGFEPTEYTVQSDTKIFFCGCKHSRAKPVCDGTHGTL